MEILYFVASISRLSYVFVCHIFFCYHAPNSLGGHIVVNLVYTYLTRGIEDSV